MARVDIVLDESGRPVLDVVLSYRNLVVLLSKLMTPSSICRFDNGCAPVGFAGPRYRGEPDELHYNTPERRGTGPGQMHPIAEAVLAAVDSALAAAAREAARSSASPFSGAAAAGGPKAEPHAEAASTAEKAPGAPRDGARGTGHRQAPGV